MLPCPDGMLREITGMLGKTELTYNGHFADVMFDDDAAAVRDEYAGIEHPGVGEHLDRRDAACRKARLGLLDRFGGMEVDAIPQCAGSFGCGREIGVVAGVGGVWCQ